MTTNAPFMGYDWNLQRRRAELRSEGLALLRDRDFSGAVEILARAEAAEPENPLVRLPLGIALQAVRRHAEALERFTAVPPESAERATACTHAVYSELALDRAQNALRFAEEGCARAPRSSQAHAALGQARLSLRQARRAEEAFLEALAIEPASADLWVQLAKARRRNADSPGAEAALRRALAIDGAHPGAKAALAEQSAEGTPTGEGDVASTRAGAIEATGTTGGGARVWQPSDPRVALGLTVDYLSKKPTFARLAFGEWTGTLSHQIRRDHQLFIVDREQRIVGFLGWALTNDVLAQAWVDGRTALRDDQCREGDCVIINAFASDTREAERLLQSTLRRLFHQKRALYFKRFYPDGRARPVRLKINPYAAARGAALAAPLT